MSLPWCVKEINRPTIYIDTNVRGERPPRREILHLAGAGDDQFREIKCDPLEGIIMPGSPIQAEPTCPECLALFKPEDTWI